MLVIELQDVNFNYNSEPVLQDINVSIEEGDYVGIIGPNGGGKTTLLKIMLGLLVPVTGRVKLFDQDLRDFKDWFKIGYLPQKAAHFDIRFPVTVREVVSQGRIAKAGLLKSFTKIDAQAIENALVASGIEKLKNRLVSDLSGGERQRVFIARALASEPKVLILDEPASGVDVGSQSTFYRFLKDLNEQHKITVVFVSHDIDVLAHEASSFICVNHKIICSGDSSRILKDKQRMLEGLYGKNAQFIIEHQ